MCVQMLQNVNNGSVYKLLSFPSREADQHSQQLHAHHPPNVMTCEGIKIHLTDFTFERKPSDWFKCKKPPEINIHLRVQTWQTFSFFVWIFFCIQVPTAVFQKFWHFLSMMMKPHSLNSSFISHKPLQARAPRPRPCRPRCHPLVQSGI